MAEENNNGGSLRQDGQQDFNFSDIWGMIWGYRWWYVLSLAVCIVFAAFYLYRTPGVYSRSAKVIIDEDAQDATLRDIANISGFGGQGSSVNVNNEVEAFSSPDLMTTVVERLGLQTGYVEHQFLRDRELYRTSPFEMSIVEPIVSSSFSFRVSRTGDSTFVLKNFTVGGNRIRKYSVDGALGDTMSTSVGEIVLLPSAYNIDSWKDDITVSWVNSTAKGKGYAARLSATVSGKQTSVVVLSLEDTYPSRAENILSTLIDVYNDEWVHDKNRSARNTTDFINERLVVIEQELGGIETSLKEYKEQNRLTDMQALSQSYLEESTEYASKSFEVNNQLSIAQYIRDYLTEPANATALIPANSGLTSADIENQISEYNQIVLQRDKLIATSSENNPLPAGNTPSPGGQDQEPGGSDYGTYHFQLRTADGASGYRKAAEGHRVAFYVPLAEAGGERDSKSCECGQHQADSVSYGCPGADIPEPDDGPAGCPCARGRHAVRDNFPLQDDGQYGQG